MDFVDRADAGRRLATRLAALDLDAPVVVALPRGGVPVGYEIARALHAPLDVLVVRKLGAPGQPELGIGAVAQGGAWFLNTPLIAALGVSRSYVRYVAAVELSEIARRLHRYRADRAPLDVAGRTAVLVDDGLATGVTTRAAIRALRMQGPRRIVLAVPVCAPQAVAEIRPEVDEVVCVAEPEHFRAVGLWYERFDQTTDDEVVELLQRAARELGPPPTAPAPRYAPHAGGSAAR